MFSLCGKKILITGASSGLGASAANLCAQEGASLVVTGRNEARLTSVFDALPGNSHEAHVCDLSHDDQVLGFADALPNLDGLVFCAGLTKTIPAKFIKRDNISEIFSVNSFSSFLLVQALLKKKKINSKASIVFVSSISTTYADKGNSIYAASKGALNSFSKVLALELSAKGIRSNCIEPGFVPTGMLAAGVVSEDQLEDERKRYPLGFGDPEDIASGILFLLSDASKWVTGTELRIDGGVTLR